MTINILIFAAGMLVGSIIGFVIASMLTIGHDSDLIDSVQGKDMQISELQRLHMQELAQRFIMTRELKAERDELEAKLTKVIDNLLSALESAEYHAGSWLISDAVYDVALQDAQAVQL